MSNVSVFCSILFLELSDKYRRKGGPRWKCSGCDKEEVKLDAKEASSKRRGK